ncbi:hypothetical protein JTB14_034465 [Gonioctena quinquepunctata]|nr:hypothetical protein JTB14_034465 [Gonioctena quinquepunctata]
MENDFRRGSQNLGNITEKLVKVHNSPDEPFDKNQQDVTVGKVENVTLTEDIFGKYWDENGTSHNIKRFTWKNKNKIEVQVINYGARITSIKLPDRKGDVDDIVLGFDDLPGYIYYKNYYFGATIGRTSHLIRNGTFHLNDKKHTLTSNYKDGHHLNGGVKGLDQVVWKTYVDNKKVIMSHVSPHKNEGYPADLLIRISFELSMKNEFRISMDATCTQPTIVNLSNLTYFNLAGHHAGPDETYKHIVTLNCNCFTRKMDGFPTGEIVNVIHSEYDFQIPRILGKVIGIVPMDGFNQNLCINRGMDQQDCFVGRVLHPPSGRMLEVYSNQYGVDFRTGNEFGYGRILSITEIIRQGQAQQKQEQQNNLTKLLNDIHEKMIDNLRDDEQNDFEEIKNIIFKIKKMEKTTKPPSTQSNPKEAITELNHVSVEDFVFTPKQIAYLRISKRWSRGKETETKGNG